MVVSHIREKVLSSFSDLIFDEVKHMYWLDGANLPSVSRLVEGHAEKTDFEAILPFSAKKQSRLEGREVTADELRARWRKTNKDACDLGHQTHDFMEYFNGTQKPRTKHEEAGVKFFLDMSKEYDVLFREIRMYSRKYKFAGTEDLILIHKETGQLVAADYKTNADLFKNFKGKTLKAPFDWAEENPYNKYQIQLSYYQIMLEEAGLNVRDRWLVYLKPDGEYKIYPLLDLTTELKDCLQAKLVA